MTMTQALFEIAPNTTKLFASWLMENYGLKLSEFESYTPKRKFLEVSRYFGYPLDEDTKLPTEEIVSFIKKTFSDYEQIILKYPNGVPNLLNELKAMSNADHTLWLEKHFYRTINISFCHAVVSGNKIIRISLHDAIKDRQLNKLELAQRYDYDRQREEERFWEDTIKNFNENEIVPF